MKPTFVKLSGPALLAYRSVAMATFAAVWWLIANFVTVKELTSYKSQQAEKWQAHDRVRDETLSLLLKSVDRLENHAIRIEAKIDRQANIRADAGAAVGKRANP